MGVRCPPSYCFFPGVSNFSAKQRSIVSKWPPQTQKIWASRPQGGNSLADNSARLDKTYARNGWKKFELFRPHRIGPSISIWTAMLAEIICGVLILIGVFTRTASAIMCLIMATAVLADIQVRSGSWELAALFFVSFLSIAILGGGELSADKTIFG